MIIFSETQRVKDIWAWLIVGGIALAAWLGLVAQLMSGRGVNAKFFAFFIPFGLLLPALLFSMKLTTQVRADGVSLQFFPFHWSFRRYAFSAIASMYIRTYSPVSEYGGWGLRWGKSGWAYNMSGDQGLQLVMKNGEQILIGTQQPQALWQAIVRVAPPYPPPVPR